MEASKNQPDLTPEKSPEVLGEHTSAGEYNEKHAKPAGNTSPIANTAGNPQAKA
jgi:hypothetical protein